MKRCQAHQGNLRSPQWAMLAFLALKGVKRLELVDWHTWTGSGRKRFLKEAEPKTKGIFNWASVGIKKTHFICIQTY